MNTTLNGKIITMEAVRLWCELSHSDKTPTYDGRTTNDYSRDDSTEFYLEIDGELLHCSFVLHDLYLPLDEFSDKVLRPLIKTMKAPTKQTIRDFKIARMKARAQCKLLPNVRRFI